MNNFPVSPFRKLKRDSAPYESDISETDKLLIQKDEEVKPIHLGTINFTCSFME